MQNYCFLTLLTDDKYLPGALVLAKSLFNAATKFDLNILLTPNVTEKAKEKLSRVYKNSINVPLLTSSLNFELELLGRPDLDITFTKIHGFDPNLLPYEKVCFLDADTLVLKNIDDIFGYLKPGVEFAAAPDIGWPDLFNSGVFVFRPNQSTYRKLIKKAVEQESFDGN
jgi:alpha-N-acetylglucosamine transferase